MKIPKYIAEHIEKNNKLLEQADKHARVVRDWYERQLERLNADESDIDDEEFEDIQTNWLDNGEIDAAAIQANLRLLEDEKNEKS